MSDKQDIKSVQKYFRSNGFDTEGMYTSEKSGDITSFIARCENPKKEYGIVKAILNMGSEEIPDNILDQTDEIEMPGERKKKKITWDKLMFKNSSINKHEFKYAFVPISVPKKAFKPDELSKKDIIDILEDMDYNATICVEQNRISGGPYVYTFEAGSPDDELVLIRIVETGPNIESHELSKYLYTDLSYKKPHGETYEVKWDEETKYFEVPTRISKTLNNRLFYIVTPAPKETTIKPGFGTGELAPKKRLKLAESYLRKNGYNDINLLGSGGLGDVFSCKKGNRELIAAKVIISHDKKTIDEELKGSKKVSDMKPIDTDRVKTLAETGSFGNDARVNGGLLEREKIFNEYINVPVIKHLNLDKKRGVYIVILEAPLMSGNLSALKLPEPEGKDKINHKMTKKTAKSVLCVLVIIHGKNIIHLDIKPQNVLEKEWEDGTISLALSDCGVVSDIVHKKAPEKCRFRPSELQELKDEFEQLLGHLGGTEAYYSPELRELFNYIKSDRQMNSILKNADEIIESFETLHDSRIEDIRKFLEELRKIGPKSDIYSLGKSLIVIADKYIAHVSSIIANMPGEHLPNKIEAYTNKMGDELSEKDKDFFRFVAKLTQFDPKDRPTAKEALNDPYLKS